MTAIALDASVGAQTRRTTRPIAASPLAPRNSDPTQRNGCGSRTAAPLRLTHRGRLAVTALLASVGVLASLFVGGVGRAGSGGEQRPLRYVTVTSGTTLWALAGEIAPQADRRDTVARILELNALPSSALRAGQRIAVPAR